MSISQQFCFVTRGPNAVPGEGAGECAFVSELGGRGIPHPAPPRATRGGFFSPLGVPVHILHLIKRPAARSRAHILIPPEFSELHHGSVHEQEPEMVRVRRAEKHPARLLLPQPTMIPIHPKKTQY